MNLSSNDYKSMICARTDHIRMFLYPQQYGQAVAPNVVGNNIMAQAEAIPDFDALKSTLGELNELVDALQTSLGPA